MMRFNRMMALLLALVLCLGMLAACDDNSADPTDNTTQNTTPSTTAPVPCDMHTDANDDEVCDICAEAITKEVYTSFHEGDTNVGDVYYPKRVYTMKMDGLYTLELYSDGEYVVIKSVDGASNKIMGIEVTFTFYGTYTRNGNEVVLSPAVFAEADENWGIGETNAQYTSDDDPSVLDLFQCSYLNAYRTNGEQKVTLNSDGTCVLENDPCDHPSHDEKTFICPQCVQYVAHDVEDGACTKCEYTTGYAYKEVPAAYHAECAQPGTIEHLTYSTKVYASDEVAENELYIYLPYGYDASADTEYPVVYLQHGGGENAAYWFAQAEYAGKEQELTKNVVDNLIYLGDMQACIIVTGTQNINGTSDYGKELRETIIPLVATQYRTKAGMYGKDISAVTDEVLRGSRDHRAMCGLSMGSITTWQSGIIHNLDIISYFGCFSAGEGINDPSASNVLEALNSEAFEEYDIHFLYNGEGTLDFARESHWELYKTLISGVTDKLVEGENTVFVDKDSLQHEYAAWIMDLYNCLKFHFFK